MLGILFLVKDDKRVRKRCREGHVIGSLKKGNQVLMLQLKDLKVDQREEPYIRINIRELDRELCTELSILYTKTNSLYYYYTSLL